MTMSVAFPLYFFQNIPLDNKVALLFAVNMYNSRVDIVDDVKILHRLFHNERRAAERTDRRLFAVIYLQCTAAIGALCIDQSHLISSLILILYRETIYSFSSVSRMELGIRLHKKFQCSVFSSDFST